MDVTVYCELGYHLPSGRWPQEAEATAKYPSYIVSHERSGQQRHVVQSYIVRTLTGPVARRLLFRMQAAVSPALPNHQIACHYEPHA